MRLASLVLSALWIGGLAALGAVAAPQAFAVLEQHDPVAGRTLAGALFGVILLKAQHYLWAIGAVQFLLIGARAALGPRPRWFKWQLAVLTLMLSVTSYSALAISPKIDHIRDTTPTTMASLPLDNPIRKEFGMLHGLSNGLMLIAVCGALFLFWADSKE